MTSDNKWTDFWFRRKNDPKAIEEAHARYIRSVRYKLALKYFEEMKTS